MIVEGGDSGAIRTRDPQLRRLLLYPTELRNLLSAAKIIKIGLIERKSKKNK